jgi:hypothetical protein
VALADNDCDLASGSEQEKETDEERETHAAELVMYMGPFFLSPNLSLSSTASTVRPSLMLITGGARLLLLPLLTSSYGLR